MHLNLSSKGVVMVGYSEFRKVGSTIDKKSLIEAGNKFQIFDPIMNRLRICLQEVIR